MKLEALLCHTDWIRALAVDVLGDADRAEDVVQDTWVAALQHLDASASDGPGLRAWLARVARNFARMRLRGEGRRRRREEAHGAPEPSASESLERIVLQREVAEAVLALDPVERDLVSLRYYDGLPPREIARRTDLKPNVVSIRLSRAKERLRARLEAREAETRSNWALVVAAWSARRASGDWMPPAAALSGGLAMKSSWMIGAGVVVLAALAIGTWRYVAQSPRMEDAASRSSAVLSAAPLEEAAESRDAVAAEASADPARVEVTAEPVAIVEEPAPVPAAVATTGTVLVRVTDSETGAPAEGIGINLYPIVGETAWFHERSHATNAEGEVRFERVPPGRAIVYIERLSGANLFDSARVTVAEGELHEVEFEVFPGESVRGVVRDASGRPVAGADIWLTSGAGPSADGTVVARSADDGTFSLRHLSAGQGLSARHPDHSPSRTLPLLFHGVETEDGYTLELVLPDAGGRIAGTVVGPGGEPVPEALVLVGVGEPGASETLRGMPTYDAPPLTLSADDRGRFLAQGIAHGSVRVEARAPGRSVASITVEVPRGGVADARLVLPAAATVRGTVRRADGGPVEGARVSLAYDPTGLRRSSVVVNDDGTFELGGVPVGAVELEVELRDEELHLSDTVETRPGEVTWWDAEFGSFVELYGVVTDEAGNPLVGWPVRREAERTEGVSAEMANAAASTDERGRFRFPGCPDVPHRLEVRAPGRWFLDPVAVEEGLEPDGTEIRLVVPSQAIDTGGLSGRLLDSAGEPLRGVQLRLQSASLYLRLETNDAGAFVAHNLPAGDFMLEIAHEGFEDRSVEVSALGESEVRALEPLVLVAKP